MVVEEEDGLGGAVSPAELAMRKLKLNEKCAILPRVPVVYQMGDCGAFTAEVALSEASTVRELVVEVLTNCSCDGRPRRARSEAGHVRLRSVGTLARE